LIRLIPGAKDTDYIRKFLARTEIVQKIRNGVQYLDGKIDRLLSLKQPTWGSISWATLEGTPPTRAKIHLLLPGSFQKSQHPMPNPAGQTFSAPLDLIWLNAYGLSIKIGDLVREVATFITQFQEIISEQVRDLPHAPAEIDVFAEVSFNPDSAQASKA
jgi:hypothetical protein